MHILTNAFSIELTLFVLQGQSCKNVFWARLRIEIIQ
jgi:hypothetical protein